MPSKNDPMEAALDAVDGYREAGAAVAAAAQRAAELRSPTAAPQTDLSGELMDALVSGKPVPDDLGRRAWEAKQYDAYRVAELEMVLGIEPRLKNRQDNALHAGAGKALAVLRPLLDELLDQARPMAKALIGVTDAQTAIDAGPDAVAAWTGFGDIVGRYQRIREAQRRLVYAACGGTGNSSIKVQGRDLVISHVLPVWGEIANVTEVWPEWEPNPLHERPLKAPWPTLDPGQPFRVHWDRDWVMWVLTTPGVRLWLPTVDELGAAYSEQTADARTRGRKRTSDRKGEPKQRRVNAQDGSTYTEWPDKDRSSRRH